ncbi:hypothetical protein E3T61_05730 [Cryobacterium lactosi]|uniref:Uncharacterized protein n=1 Tax=Cryobacterium lactosi TaxID=1259202 RepID=A0A4R9BY69_9MICO|nr:hypothetical protein [Cryobacterium lactosi]TFD92958.1 hypothetical protein E3T61_05730 [Cryobacterium lactosi]
MAAKQLPPFPVVLDRTEDRTFSAFTLALGHYAETARASAAAEGESEQPNQYRIADLYANPVGAEKLPEDVERQLTQAGRALS